MSCLKGVNIHSEDTEVRYLVFFVGIKGPEVQFIL